MHHAATLVPTLLISTVLSCAASKGPPIKVRRGAADDLGCPQAELLYHRLGNDMYRITGCGQEVHYTYVCPRGNCLWRREGAPRSAVSAQ